MAKKKADLNLKFKKIYAKAMINKQKKLIKSITGKAFTFSRLEEDVKGDHTHICRLLTDDGIKIPGRGNDELSAVIAVFNHLEDMGVTLDYGQ